MMKSNFKSGFVAIVGRPNVGKSTLLNYLIKHKISIVTDKVQTTRNKIEGIYSDEDSQIIFIDTPGIHKPFNKLGQQLNKVAYSSLRDNELTLLVSDASEEIGPGDKYLIEQLKTLKSPLVLVLNKIDLISKNELIKVILDWSKLHEFKAIIPISSLTGENTNELIKVIKEHLPYGPMYYPKETITSYPERFIIGELIREKILILTKEEIPHSIAVVVEDMKKKQKHFHIYATIIVDKKSKKGIIIGKEGSMLKEVGTRARKDIENLLGIKIMLELFVRVEKDWRDDNRYLKEFGYKDD